MKSLIFIIALLLLVPFVSAYIIEIDPEGQSGDVVLATQILLQVDGGRAELSNELTDKEREDNLLLYISNGEVYLIEGENYNGIVPQRLLQYVTKDNIPQKVVEEENETKEEDVICLDFEKKTISCPDSDLEVECACINGEWTCDYSVCEVTQEEEIVVEAVEFEPVKEKVSVWNRIKNFFRGLFG